MVSTFLVFLGEPAAISDIGGFKKARMEQHNKVRKLGMKPPARKMTQNGGVAKELNLISTIQ